MCTASAGTLLLCPVAQAFWTDKFTYKSARLYQGWKKSVCSPQVRVLSLEAQDCLRFVNCII